MQPSLSSSVGTKAIIPDYWAFLGYISFKNGNFLLASPHPVPGVVPADNFSG
jgi:hypothetical protein